MTNDKYYKFYKPFGVICQFSEDGQHQTIADFMTQIPKNVYPIGRLDTDSEGLLLLTNDKTVNNKLLNPINEHHKIYFVQVEGIATIDQILVLKNGVEISIDGKKYETKKADVSILENEPILPERDPPIRFRKNSPTSWLRIAITEGKNRQVRKMTASVGLPTLRLVRFAIESINIESMKSGEWFEIDQKTFYKELNL